jgi:hypothetical protein
MWTLSPRSVRAVIFSEKQNSSEGMGGYMLTRAEFVKPTRGTAQTAAFDRTLERLDWWIANSWLVGILGPGIIQYFAFPLVAGLCVGGYGIASLLLTFISIEIETFRQLTKSAWYWPLVIIAAVLLLAELCLLLRRLFPFWFCILAM